MSRFYDVLKEASRWTQDAEPDIGKRNWDATGLPPVEVPPATAVPQTAAAGEPAPQDTPATEPALGTVTPEIPDAGLGSQNGAFGSPAQALVDEQARLIPHVAEPSIVEHYRRLRTKILQEQAAKTFRTLVVTSPGPQDGKTVTTLNLAFSFGMLPSFKVLVVDGDLRRGSLGEWLGVKSRPGLSNLIDGSAQVEEVALRCEGIPMHVIVRGTSEVPPAELLHSPQLGSHFRRMAEHFDLILVDSPPVNLITDAQLLAGGCDAVLLVVRAFSTTSKALESAVQDLLPFRVIGTVLNAGTRGRARAYHKYY